MDEENNSSTSKNNKNGVIFYTSDLTYVYGNKEKLSKISPILKSILYFSNEDGSNHKIPVNFPAKILKTFVNYSNGCEEEIFGNEIELYEVAKEFGVQDLKEKCMASLKYRVTILQGLSDTHKIFVAEKQPIIDNKNPNSIPDVSLSTKNVYRRHTNDKQRRQPRLEGKKKVSKTKLRKLRAAAKPHMLGRHQQKL